MTTAHPDEQSGRLSHASPPPVLRRIVNPLLLTVLESPVHRPLSGALAVLTYLGRKSGEQYRLVVGYGELPDGGFRVWTNGGWKASFRGEGGHPATLRVAGRDHLCLGTAVEDPDTVVPAAYEYLRGGGDPRRLDLRVRGDGPVSVDDVRAAVPPLAWVEFRPQQTL